MVPVHLQNSADLKDALREIMKDGACTEEDHFQRLRAAGLVKGDTRRDVHLRCQLYEDYFKKRL